MVPDINNEKSGEIQIDDQNESIKVLEIAASKIQKVVLR